MGKEYLPYQVVRNNSIKLAHRILEDNFIPSVIYVSLRGGAYLGNIISEYFKLKIHSNPPVFYAAVVARSYSDVHQQDKVRIDGWTYEPSQLAAHDRVLLVDDIFDSGTTINKLATIISQQEILRENLVIAVHDYKIRNYRNDNHRFVPDYCCRRIEVNSSEEDNWIHYLSHELVGLNDQEIDSYYSDDKEIITILKNQGSK